MKDEDKRKIEWLYANDFIRDYCPIRKTIIYSYKGFSWIIEEIEMTNIKILKLYKKFYDNKITESQLDNLIRNI